MTEKTLDVKGLSCPLPVLKARRAMQDLASGDLLVMLATDPGAKSDVPHFCEASGHELVSAEDAGGVLTFRIRKK